MLEAAIICRSAHSSDLYRISKKLWSLQQQLVHFCITKAATVDVLVQSPSCQASCDEIQDEVDDRQRSGQSPSHTESHGDDLLSLSLKRKEVTPATSSTSYETSRERCYCTQAAEGMRAKSC